MTICKVYQNLTDILYDTENEKMPLPNRTCAEDIAVHVCERVCDENRRRPLDICVVGQTIIHKQRNSYATRGIKLQKQRNDDVTRLPLNAPSKTTVDKTAIELRKEYDDAVLEVCPRAFYMAASTGLVSGKEFGCTVKGKN